MRENSENRREERFQTNRATMIGAFALFALFPLLWLCTWKLEASSLRACESRGPVHYVRSVATDPVILADNETEETPTATPTPELTQAPSRKDKLKTIAAEKYALGVILASAISIGILIVLFRYWSRRSGGRRE